MARGRQVTIQFIGDARSLVSATNASGKATSSLGSKFKALGKSAALGAGVATVALGKALWEATEGAIADEKAAKSLALQLKNTTGATDSQIASVEKWITAQGKALGVTDDELRPALSKLATATGDVTKAQSLLATAMDVSAGTGKSLDSVTSALQKGVNGSVGGLSRLGVKTKDASGETKSFDAILKDLNKNFTGQAAKAADTTAGKYQRMKVNLSELGEEIGYKVLPYATKFGEWLLDEGVPAAEDFTHWIGDELGPVMGDLAGFLKDNKDEAKDFAEAAADTLIPALETLADVTGDVVGFVSDLPGPVKEFGVQALVASRLVGGLNANIAGARTGIAAFTTSTDAAAKRTEALGKAARAAAGMGGMLLLADGAQRTDSALGLLETTAGGALAGSAAGPWGALIGGGLGLAMGIFARSTNDAADSMSVAAPIATDFASSLDEITGAATRSTRELISLDLQQMDVAGSASALGLSQRDLVNYLMGNEKAVKKVNRALETTTQETTYVSDGMGHMVAITAQGTAAQRKLALALGASAERIQKSTAETLRASLANDSMRQVVKGLAEQYRLTPKQVTTAIKANGLVNTNADAQRLIDRLAEIERNKNKTVTIRYNEIGRPNNINSGTGRIGAGGTGGTGFSDFRDAINGFTTSAFSTDFTDPNTGESAVSIEAMLAFQKAELAKAQKLKADIAALVSKGVSKNVLDQLAASGAGGIAQISALAAGTTGQIAEFSALNAMTSSALSGAGLAGSPAWGGGAGTNGMNQQTSLLTKLVKQGERESRVDVKLTGDQIVWSIRKVERKLGVRLLVT